MEKHTCKFPFLSGNALKILAALFMVCDHVGVVFFPSILFLRIVGRLAFPVFAFMIAEGCKYTKNKLRYFLTIFSLGAMFQAVYYIAEKSLYMGILITFSLSVLLIYALDLFKEQLFTGKLLGKLLSFAVFALSVVGVYFLNERIQIDYKFWGCMTPVFASIFHHDVRGKYDVPALKKWDTVPVNVLTMGVCLLFLAASLIKIQYYALLAIPLLLLYSGKRGKYKMKYFFYIFYPAHLVIIYGISMLL